MDPCKSKNHLFIRSRNHLSVFFIVNTPFLINFLSPPQREGKDAIVIHSTALGGPDCAEARWSSLPLLLLFGTHHTTQKYDFRRPEYATPKYTSLVYFEAAILRNRRHRNAEKLYFCGGKLTSTLVNYIRMMAVPSGSYQLGDVIYNKSIITPTPSRWLVSNAVRSPKSPRFHSVFQDTM